MQLSVCCFPLHFFFFKFYTFLQLSGKYKASDFEEQLLWRLLPFPSEHSIPGRGLRPEWPLSCTSLLWSLHSEVPWGSSPTLQLTIREKGFNLRQQAVAFLFFLDESNDGDLRTCHWCSISSFFITIFLPVKIRGGLYICSVLCCTVSSVLSYFH